MRDNWSGFLARAANAQALGRLQGCAADRVRGHGGGMARSPPRGTLGAAGRRPDPTAAKSRMGQLAVATHAERRTVQHQTLLTGCR